MNKLEKAFIGQTNVYEASPRGLCYIKAEHICCLKIYRGHTLKWDKFIKTEHKLNKG